MIEALKELGKNSTVERLELNRLLQEADLMIQQSPGGQGNIQSGPNFTPSPPHTQVPVPVDMPGEPEQGYDGDESP